MAGRPRRARRQLNYRRVHLVGLDDDSSEDEIRDIGDHLYEDQSNVDDTVPADTLDESSEDEDNSGDLTTRGSIVASDGTIWSRDQPDTPFPPWRSGLINFHDGPKGAARDAELTIADTFKLLLTDDILSDICHWTNKYAEKVKDDINNSIPPPKHPKKWQNLTVIELRAFVGLLLLAGIEKAKKKPWSELWNTSEAIRCPPFTATLSMKRFYSIVSMLRFDDVFERRKRNPSSQAPSSSKSTSSNYDELEPIKDISTRIISNFAGLYEPASKLCVDEQLVKFRGNCPFRVYMPDKPGKYGIKVWACVDDSSGYILKLQIYQGKRSGGREVGQGKRVVLDMTSDYFGTKRGVVADNFFSSMALVQELLHHDLSYVGTLRKNRREVPPLMKETKEAEAKSSFFLFHEPSQITLVRYLPTTSTYVLLISSAHCDRSMTVTKSGEKPSIIDYYNATKSGVDTADQMISSYTCQFPSKRFSMKLFLHLIDCCALNASVIWMKNNPHWNETTRSRRRLFIRQLSYDLVAPQIEARASSIPNLHRPIRSAMAIMGVKYKSNDSKGTVMKQKCNIKDHPSKQGRCPFCSENTAEQTVSRRCCFQCKTFICQEHWNYICPECCKKLQPTEAIGNDSSELDEDVSE